ncbi:MAG: hypothetical protein P4L55_16375 [Syntrophobacteraceae bacterium]|nr:hypothetical protein [Syntrophobacteraceae bacterium]
MLVSFAGEKPDLWNQEAVFSPIPPVRVANPSPAKPLPGSFYFRTVEVFHFSLGHQPANLNPRFDPNPVAEDRHTLYGAGMLDGKPEFLQQRLGFEVTEAFNLDQKAYLSGGSDAFRKHSGNLTHIFRRDMFADLEPENIPGTAAQKFEHGGVSVPQRLL